MLESSTYYLLDAQGNQLSVYKHVVDTATTTARYYLTERNIYGSSRLGAVKSRLDMTNPHPKPSYGLLGYRQYELTNHLNNVLTVINDIVYPISSDNTTIDGYEVGISSVTDYSPFGVEMDGRSFSNNKFRYSFQNQEVDKETGLVNYKYRMHNPLLGRFLSLYSLSDKYPWNSSYAFSENRVIDGVELEGKEKDLIYAYDPSLINFRSKHSYAENRKYAESFERGKTLGLATGGAVALVVGSAYVTRGTSISYTIRLLGLAALGQHMNATDQYNAARNPKVRAKYKARMKSSMNTMMFSASSFTLAGGISSRLLTGISNKGLQLCLKGFNYGVANLAGQLSVLGSFQKVDLTSVGLSAIGGAIGGKYLSLGIGALDAGIDFSLGSGLSVAGKNKNMGAVGSDLFFSGSFGALNQKMRVVKMRSETLNLLLDLYKARLNTKSNKLLENKSSDNSSKASE